MQELGAKQYFNLLFDSPSNFPQACSYDHLQRKAAQSSVEPAHCQQYLQSKLAFSFQACYHNLPFPKSMFWAETWFFKGQKYKESPRQNPWILFYA